MKRSASGILATTIFVIACLFSSVQAASAAVGRTPGTFSVSNTGAATYTIPLWTPPGVHGIQPNLALVYNSRSGAGFLGPGWSLAGLSTITRCNGTWAQDGVPGQVSLAMTDRFCLDGQRLRITSGGVASYGQPGTTYQTEVANFKNVIASSSTAGSGPAYFTVQGKDGLYYEYGNPTDPQGGTTNAQVIASGATTPYAWALDKVSDRNGNYLIIHYLQSSGSYVPSTIQYTYTTSNGGNTGYEVSFTYTTASPSQVGYINGASVQQPNVLTTITVTHSSTTVRVYNLVYTQSAATSRGLLTSVQECGGSSGGDCLTVPTQIGYQPGGVGVTSPTNSSGVSASGFGPIYSVDIDGDGRTDLVYAVVSGSNYHWYVARSTGNGFGSPVDTGIVIPTSSPILFDDFLGNGRTDILAPSSGTWYLYQWNGSTISSTSTGATLDTAREGDPYSYVAADVNGDGLPDLVWPRSDGYLYVRLNAMSGGALAFSAATQSINYSSFTGSCTTQLFGANSFPNSSVRHLDFNGDGREDILLVDCGGNNWPMLSSGSVTAPSFQGFVYLAPGTVLPLNWNDDSCTDLALITDNGVSQSWTNVYVAPCNGQAGGTVANLTYAAHAALDWDGDGRDDLWLNSGTDSSTVSISSGVGVKTTLSASFPAPRNPVVMDADGDRLGDLLVNAGGTLEFGLHNGAGAPPDLAASFTDGYGNSVTVSYASIVQAYNAYYFPWNDAQYPYENYLGPMYIVTNAAFSDPSNQGGSYSQSHFYSGAWMNLQGRGFAGFGSHQIADARNGIYETWGYGRGFPYTGMLTSDTATQNNNPNLTLFSLVRAPATTTLDGTLYNSRYFPYIANDSLSAYEVGGPKNGQLITTTATTYSFDNYGNSTGIVRTVTDKDSGSPYYGQSWKTTTTNTPDVDSSHWCLTLLTETQVAYSSTQDTTPVTRTKTFTPDTVNCRNTQIITEPSSPQYKLTENLGFDGFGNINSDIVSGINIARQTTADWGTTGQFPMTITDASNAVTHYNYNMSFGIPSSVTDPNGLTTSWFYDDFGRKTQESRADGTFTQWTYNDCSTGGSCVIGTHTPIITFGVYNKDGSVLTDGSTWLDSLERAYLSNTRMLANGAYSRAELRYDSLGRVARQAFPCTWSALTSTCQFWTTNSYDVLNRLTQAQRPTSSIDTTPQTTAYQYQGRTTVITDANQHAKTLVYDVNGRLRSTADAGGYTVTIGYDAAGSKNATTDSLGNPLWSGTYQYGTGAFLVAETDADRGTWSYGYDALGELTSWTDAKGQHFSSTYDALSRPLTRSEPDLFTQWTWGSSASAHEIGQLHSVCTGTGTNPSNCTTSPGYAESEFYDNVGRPSQRAIQIPGDGTYTYTWAYNPTTQLLDTLTYPTSTPGYALQVKYGYSNGILQSITDVRDTPNVTLWTANAANPLGQVTQETLGNGVVVTHNFDAVTGWLGSLTAGHGGGAALQNNSFLFDKVGNLIQRQDGNRGLTENLVYDALNRLKQSTLNGVTNLSMTFDSTGNMLTSQLEGGSVNTNDFQTHQPGCTYYANAQPHAIHSSTSTDSGVTSYCYDANGNGTAELVGGSTFGASTWTSYNQPQVMSLYDGTSNQYFYDGNHQRWQQLATYSNGPETTEYIGGLFEKITNSNGTAYDHYIPAGNNTVLYTRWSTGETPTYYITKDHLGSSALITDASGAAVVTESFAALGYRRSATTWAGPPSDAEWAAIASTTRRGFTGQEMIDSLDLVNMNGRIYSETGQFTSPDPLVSDPTDTQSYNRYSYVRNNPLTRTDPTGFDDAGDDSGGDPGDGGDIPGCPGAAACQPAASAPLPPPPPAPPRLPIEFYDPSATIYFANGLTYEGGLGFDNGLMAYDETGGVTMDGNTYTHTSVGFYSGSRRDSDFSNYLGRFNPDTGYFSSAFDGVSDLFSPDLIAQFGSPGVRALYGAQSTAYNFAAASLWAGVIIGTSGGSAAESLVPAAERAAQIADTLGRTKGWVTIGVTDTAEGVRVISSSENALRPAALNALRNGEIAVTGAGHAEVTGVNAARELGLTPIGTAASRLICPACAQFLQDEGVAPLSPLK